MKTSILGIRESDGIIRFITDESYEKAPHGKTKTEKLEADPRLVKVRSFIEMLNAQFKDRVHSASNRAYKENKYYIDFRSRTMKIRSHDTDEIKRAKYIFDNIRGRQRIRDDSDSLYYPAPENGDYEDIEDDSRHTILMVLFREAEKITDETRRNIEMINIENFAKDIGKNDLIHITHPDLDNSLPPAILLRTRSERDTPFHALLSNGAGCGGTYIYDTCDVDSDGKKIPRKKTGRLIDFFFDGNGIDTEKVSIANP